MDNALKRKVVNEVNVFLRNTVMRGERSQGKASNNDETLKLTAKLLPKLDTNQYGG